jgi:hypothetical protein
MSKRPVNDVSQNSGDSPRDIEIPDDFFVPEDEEALRNNGFMFNEVFIDEVERELANQEFNFLDFPRFSLGLAKVFNSKG